MFLIKLIDAKQEIALAIANEFKDVSYAKKSAVLHIKNPDHLFPLIIYLNKINIKFHIQCKTPTQKSNY